ncbi:hypothetical protein JCM8547_006637 [Rhodosporidiobolus lusitaniae]
MFSSLRSSASVKVALEEDQIFLHPLASDFPTVDPIVRGTALLTLSSRRAVKTVKVVLEGLVDAWGGEGWPYETSTSLRKELVQDLHGEVLPAGNHGFNFAFIIPSSVAVSQRSSYGRTRYYVKAFVDFDGGLLSGSVTSPPTILWLATNPSPPGELPSPTNVSFQHFSDDLGPIGITLASPYLTAGALCNIRLTLLGPPRPVTILSVEGIVHQSFEVTYQNGKVARPTPREHVLVKVDERASPSLTMPMHNPAVCTVAPSVSQAAPPAITPSSPLQRPSTCCPILPDVPIPDPSPLCTLSPSQDYSYARILRVPSDNFVRATTLEGTVTPLRVLHDLRVRVRYKVGEEGEEMNLTLGKPVTIASCCCLLDALYLPSYSQKAPKTVVRPNVDFCACGYSLKNLMDRDGEALQRSGPLEAPTSAPRLLGIDGEVIDPATKSPAYTAAEQAGWTSTVPLVRELEP